MMIKLDDINTTSKKYKPIRLTIPKEFILFTDKVGKKLDEKIPGLLPKTNNNHRRKQILLHMANKLDEKKLFVEGKRKVKSRAFEINMHYDE